MAVRALILTGFGINCDRETAYAFERSGAQADRVHLNDLIAAPKQLENYAIFAAPGGFSFGDDIASGRVLANRLRYGLGEHLRAFVDSGKLVVGICNGFQVLVKMGLLPYTCGEMAQEATVTHNDSARFEDRWVRLAVNADSPCVWLRGIAHLELPVRHGEGKFMPASEEAGRELQRKGQVALRYAAADGASANGAYPANPNGSFDDIAGICDPSGRVLGLMPHPEAHMARTNHPLWTRDSSLDPTADGEGLALFRNAVAYAKELRL